MSDDNSFAEKFAIWWVTPNTNLGGVSPQEMYKTGRSEKLCKWIDTALSENSREE